MKRALSLCALTVLLAFAAVPAFAGSAKARVPFAFSVGNVTLVAGDYQIEPCGNSGIYSITSIDGRRVMVLTRYQGAAVSDTSRLIFVREDKGYALAEIHMAGAGLAGWIRTNPRSSYQVAVALQ